MDKSLSGLIYLTSPLDTFDLYVKPNTLNQLLLPSSAHPAFVTRSSVYSQALRYRRICATDELFELRVEDLRRKLLERGYSEAVVQAGIQRAREVPRVVALEKVEKEEVAAGERVRQHRLIVQFDRRSSPALGTILLNNYGAAGARDSRFTKLFPLPPKPTFTRGTNIRQLLVRAKLPEKKPVSTRLAARVEGGVRRCNRGTGRAQCKACSYVTRTPSEIVKEIKITSSGETLSITDKIDCKTSSFLYVLESDKNPKQYFGQSGDTVAGRAGRHGRDIANGMPTSVADHFAETSSGQENLVFTPVRVIRSGNPWVRLHYEREMINKHDFIDKGINKNV
jgi:hypothetical protein